MSVRVVFMERSGFSIQFLPLLLQKSLEETIAQIIIMKVRMSVRVIFTERSGVKIVSRTELSRIIENLFNNGYFSIQIYSYLINPLEVTG
jgi:hypothetical protein